MPSLLHNSEFIALFLSLAVGLILRVRLASQLAKLNGTRRSQPLGILLLDRCHEQIEVLVRVFLGFLGPPVPYVHA